MYTDIYTADLNKISYARVLVKVDITKTLVEYIDIDTPSGTIQQSIAYDRKPKFCLDCNHFGHDKDICWRTIHISTEGEEFQAPKQRIRTKNKRVIQEWKQKEVAKVVHDSASAINKVEISKGGHH